MPFLLIYSFNARLVNHSFIHTYIHIYIHTHAYIYMIYVYTCMCIYIYIYTQRERESDREREREREREIQRYSLPRAIPLRGEEGVHRRRRYDNHTTSYIYIYTYICYVCMYIHIHYIYTYVCTYIIICLIIKFNNYNMFNHYTYNSNGDHHSNDNFVYLIIYIHILNI